jgi:hypothetical protein
MTLETTATTIPTVFDAEWAEWHDAHEKQRAGEHGFLAVTGIFWLDATPTRYDGAPGLWSTSDSGPVVQLADDESLTLDGAVIAGTHAFGLIPERGGVTVSFGDAVVEVARRGGFDILRPRHPEHPLRLNYQGTASFPSNSRWVIEGTFIPFDSPKPVTVGSVAEGLQHVYEALGAVEFELDGQPFRLTAFNGHQQGTLLLLFTDATSGRTTYAANRSLSVSAPNAGGRVVLDFNRAVNLPCAYTDFATCPLPPAENRLAIAIEAGEKIPAERGGPTHS